MRNTDGYDFEDMECIYVAKLQERLCLWNWASNLLSNSVLYVLRNTLVFSNGLFKPAALENTCISQQLLCCVCIVCDLHFCAE